MDKDDRASYIDRYSRRLREHGYGPQALGWGTGGKQEIRFAALSEDVLREPRSSVLDVGCGFSDLFDFLRAGGWNGEYVGIDLVPDLLNVARERHPGIHLEECDLADFAGRGERFDFVIASGVLNAKLTADSNEAHIERSLGYMFALAGTAVSVDFLSTHVTFQDPTAWHTDPGWAIRTGSKLTRRLKLRHDYMPYEFALFLYRDDRTSSRNVFRAHELPEFLPLDAPSR